MRKLLSVILLGLMTLAACGDSDPTGPARPSDASPSEVPSVVGDPVDHAVIGVYSAPSVAGPSSAPTYVGDRLALLRFLADFRAAGDRGEQLAAEIEAAATAVPPKRGRTLVAAVVGASCDAVKPDQVTVRVVGDRLDITGPPPRTDIQCLVALTSVALVQVPKDVVQLPKDETRSADPATD